MYLLANSDRERHSTCEATLFLMNGIGKADMSHSSLTGGSPE